MEGEEVPSYREEDGVDPGSLTETYVAAKLFVEGLRRTGRDLNREKFIDTLEKMNDVDLGGFYAGFSPKSHSASRFVDLTIIGRDGKFLR